MINKKQLLFFFLFLFILTFFFGQPVLAQNISFTPQVGIGDEIKAGEAMPITSATLAEYLINIYDWALRAIVVLAIVMIMIAGFRWMTAGGSAPLISQAKDQITSSLIGLLIAIGSYALLNFINPSLVRFRSLDLTPIEEISAFRNCGNCEEGQICIRKSTTEMQGYCVNNVNIWTKHTEGLEATITKDIWDYETYHYLCGLVVWSQAGNYIGSYCDESGEICVIEDNIYSEQAPMTMDRIGKSGLLGKPWVESSYKNAQCIRSTGLWCPEKKTKEECEYDEKGSRIACEWWEGKCVDQACTSAWEGGLPCGGNCGEITGIGAIPTDGIKPAQCQDASPALTKFLICMNSPVNRKEVGLEKEKWDFVITSISDDDGLQKCRESYDANICAHEQGSLHYGGGTSVYGSYAADFRCMYGEEQLPKDKFKDLVKTCGGSFLNECTKRYANNKHYHTSVPIE